MTVDVAPNRRSKDICGTYLPTSRGGTTAAYLAAEERRPHLQEDAEISSFLHLYPVDLWLSWAKAAHLERNDL
jgi:hypothetical protein